MKKILSFVFFFGFSIMAFASFELLNFKNTAFAKNTFKMNVQNFECTQSVNYNQTFSFTCPGGQVTYFTASGTCTATSSTCQKATTMATNCAINAAVTNAELQFQILADECPPVPGI